MIAVAALLLSAPAMAQTSGQSVTQPSPNQNNPQAQTNDNQQPPSARRADGPAVGQQLTQPSANQNQPQTQTNNNQQPGRNVRQTQ